MKTPTEPPLKIFTGYDPRQRIATAVLHQSLIERASVPVSLTPLKIEQLPMSEQGLTPFTFTRFLVPHLCGFEGWGLFLDNDMLVRGDVLGLFAQGDETKALQVVKVEQRFEWPAVILWNCAHPANQNLTPEYVETYARELYGFNWLGEQADDLVGDLPSDWHHVVGYSPPGANPKLVHYTAGIPYHLLCQSCDQAGAWLAEFERLLAVSPWHAIMGPSRHVVRVQDSKGQEHVLPRSHPAVQQVLARRNGETPEPRTVASKR